MSSGKKRPNNDLLQRLPREKAGHRFLKHDVFLSHNQNDGSHLLCEALTGLGADAWHDGYADMAQRNVRSLVWGALTDSRYICVCVADGFRDSEWVKVEYNSGLHIERGFGIPRVIVALTGLSAKAPAELSGHPTFDVHSEGVQRLAEFVLSENSSRSNSDRVRARGKALRGKINQHTNIRLTSLELARLGRIRAEKQKSGRGAHAAWVISHAELVRIQRDGLIPLKSSQWS